MRFIPIQPFILFLTVQVRFRKGKVVIEKCSKKEKKIEREMIQSNSLLKAGFYSQRNHANPVKIIAEEKKSEKFILQNAVHSLKIVIP